MKPLPPFNRLLLRLTTELAAEHDKAISVLHGEIVRLGRGDHGPDFPMVRDYSPRTLRDLPAPPDSGPSVSHLHATRRVAPGLDAGGGLESVRDYAGLPPPEPTMDPTDMLLAVEEDSELLAAARAITVDTRHYLVASAEADYLPMAGATATLRPSSVVTMMGPVAGGDYVVKNVGDVRQSMGDDAPCQSFSDDTTYADRHTVTSRRGDKTGVEEFPLSEPSLTCTRSSQSSRSRKSARRSKALDAAPGLQKEAWLCWHALIEAADLKVGLGDDAARVNDVWLRAKDVEKYNLGNLLHQVVHCPETPGNGVSCVTDVREGSSVVPELTSSSRRPCFGWFLSIFCRPLHPGGRVRTSWDLFSIMLLTHDLIIIPMNLSFDLPEGQKKFMRNLDLVSGCFWTLDMMVAFRTGFFTMEGLVEMNLLKIARYYLHSWFYMDFLIVAVDWTSFYLSQQANASDATQSPTDFLRFGKTFSRFMRLLRLLRFMKLSNTMKDFMARINSEYILTVLNIVKILILMVVTNHYIACFWYKLSTLLINHPHISRTWVVNKNLVEDDTEEPLAPLAYAYFTSLHWSLTQFTPASMEVFPCNEFERLFNIVVIIMALVIFSSFLSSITAAMNNIRTISAQKTQREAAIRSYFAEYKISPRLASRVWHYVRQHKMTFTRRMKEEDIPTLKLLPQDIRDLLHIEVFTPTLEQHPLLRRYGKVDSVAIGKMCKQALRELSLRVGETVFKDTATEVRMMLFVVHGVLEYQLGDDMRDFEYIQKGSWACESALWLAHSVAEGLFVAAQGGCEVVLVDGMEVQRIAEAQTESAGLLARYAELFVQGFNDAMRHWIKEDGVLFNNAEVIEELTRRALVEWNPSRGGSTILTTLKKAVRASTVGGKRNSTSRHADTRRSSGSTKSWDSSDELATSDSRVT